MTDGLDLVGEIRGRVGQDSLPNPSALMGLIWKVSEAVRFDLAAVVGLNRGASEWGIVAGLTYELPAFPWGRAAAW